ncbi:MAG: hypothetical protein QOJ32_2569, partial [Frankiaceae bacterium]|nr:hypothetical protein [Frankiaceae bacterium]
MTAEDAAGRLVGGPLGAAADGVTDLGFA